MGPRFQSLLAAAGFLVFFSAATAVSSAAPFWTHWKPMLPDLYDIAVGIESARESVNDSATQIKSYPIAKQQSFATKYGNVAGSVNLYYSDWISLVNKNRPIDFAKFQQRQATLVIQITALQAAADSIIAQNSTQTSQQQSAVLALALKAVASCRTNKCIQKAQQEVNALSDTERTALVSDITALKWPAWSTVGVDRASAKAQTASPTPTNSPRSNPH